MSCQTVSSLAVSGLNEQGFPWKMTQVPSLPELAVELSIGRRTAGKTLQKRFPGILILMPHWMHCNWSYVLLKFLFPVMNTFTDKNNYRSNKLTERYFYNAGIFIGNLALSGAFLWSWNEVVLCSPVNLVANKNKTKTSDVISILIRKMSRWTIIC